MKRSLLSLLLITAFSFLFSQNDNVGVGTLTPHQSAILELQSTNKGLLIPRADTGSVNAFGTPATGLLIFHRWPTNSF